MRITGDGGIGSSGSAIHEFSADVKAERLTVSLDATITGNVNSEGNIVGLTVGGTEIRIAQTSAPTTAVGVMTATNVNTVRLSATADAHFDFVNPGVIQMRYNGAAGVAGNIQFYDGAGDRNGYVGYASNDDLRLWNEETAGLIYLATGNTERVRITAAGALVVGGEALLEAITHQFFVRRASSSALQVINRAPIADTGHGIDILLGAAGNAANPGNSNLFIRFRRGDSTVVGDIQGDAGDVNFRGNIVAWSDERIKDSISDDLSNAVAMFDQIPWRTYRQKNIDTWTSGVVAQQLAEVPAWRHAVKDSDPERWGVNYLAFIGAIGAKLVDVDRRLRALEER